MQDDEYKQLKEAFVTGLQGTTAREVFVVFGIMPGSFWLYSELMLLLEVAGVRQLGAGNFNLPVTILVEMFVLVMPTMVAFTFAEYAIPLFVSVYSFALALSLLSWKHAKEYMHKHYRKEKMNQLLAKELPFLTNFRAQIMISTYFAILAVDFTVFPRRFAKTETFGFSVMDIGVGAFIVSSGIVSAYARQARPSDTTGSKSRARNHVKSFYEKLYAFLRPVALVLVFGIARFATVKGVNYQEHVTEYGVHWNFYFTLAAVYLIYSLLQLFDPWTTNPFVALIIVIGYQLYLSCDGGEDYILNAPRDDLFSQNREGILSLAGYSSLYILSVFAGQVIFGYMDSNGAKATRNMRWLVISCFGVSVTLVVATYVSAKMIARPSRRMMNLPYVLWVLAQTAILLTIYSAVQVICLLPRTPLLFQGVSHNQLFVFIIANLATGAVNLSMRTIETSVLTASGVLILYMLAVSTVASLLEHKNIRIKL